MMDVRTERIEIMSGCYVFEKFGGEEEKSREILGVDFGGCKYILSVWRVGKGEKS